MDEAGELFTETGEILLTENNENIMLDGEITGQNTYIVKLSKPIQYTPKSYGYWSVGIELEVELENGKKITELTQLTTPTSDNILVVVDNPLGSPVTKKTTVEDLGSSIFSITGSVINVLDPQYDVTG